MVISMKKVPHQGMLPLLDYLEQFRTIQIATARQQGKTYTLLELFKYFNSILVVPTYRGSAIEGMSF